ncbi:MAG: iron-sulfur cluster-binding protein [Proteobacteria bacterium]|nr:iron-sulfur cluster-binding protein [Pseudomonadota bacterium]
MTRIATENYREEAIKGINDPVLQKALANLQMRLGRGAEEAYRNLPEGPGLRRKAHEIRMNAIENLDVLLELLADKIRSRGGHVFFAEDADAAVTYCLETAQKHNVRLAVKGKSMITEEIGLNDAFAAADIEVAETDLGEYIIQLAGEHPSHIIAPAIHKTRSEIGLLFSEKLNIPYTTDPETLTRAARKALREKFLSAGMGISGCNIACAETGHITVVSNEGNIRMSTTLPKVHVAFMGMERITARLSDHDILFRLLSRGAAAQKMAGYVSYIGGPRISGQADGPDEFHLVIIDNGRTKILADNEFREMLCCIRCGACLNMCPVYGEIGGHAYGYAYTGPVGAVVTPLLVGINRAKDLCLGETLCGACKDACPVDIDLPRMLLLLRAKLADGDEKWNVKRENTGEKILYGIWSEIVRRRWAYDAMLNLSREGLRLFTGKEGMISSFPFFLKGWTDSRDMKLPARESFMLQWKKSEKQKRVK